MDYTRYARAVVLLEEKNREFAARPGEEMKGYLRVETGSGRGAIRCVMQNVRFYPRSEYTYRLILFGKRAERTIHTVVGTIPVTRFGSGEVYLRFDPQNVDGQGNDYSRYTTAIVAAVSSSDPAEPLHPVLMGRTGREEEGARVTVQAERSEPDEERAGKPTGGCSSRKTYNHFYNDYLKNVCAYFYHVPGPGQEVRPFGTAGRGTGGMSAFPMEFGHARWLKFDDPGSMFLVSPGARYFAEKYGHFLLGYGDAGEAGGGLPQAYYVAVPGRFRKEEQPDGGDSGFQYWLPLGEGERTAETYGYWILEIDGETGDIFAPEV